MRRNSRMKRNESKEFSNKVIVYTGAAIVIVTIILFGVLMYSKKMNNEVKNSTMSLEDMATILGNTTQNTESASSEIGKTVNEVESANNIISNNTVSNTTNNANTTNNTANVTKNETTNKAVTTNAKEDKPVKKELQFVKPVDGDIVREYAKDNLIYSETLQEWTTHLGIDIKAEKTTVVKSAESGTVKTIKNDPRYGLTIVIEHSDGYQTIYSNLLTSEFVVEGEKVEAGQSIGTVGNTAVFEIADEAHLHFEILKDSVQIDPSIYIK